MSEHLPTAAETYQMESSRWNTGRNTLAFVALASVLACVAGYVLYPARFFQSYLIAFSFTTFVGLGSFFFVMVQYLTGSAWSVTMRRIMENIMITLPFGLILFIPVVLGMEHLYPWTNHETVAASEALEAKSSYLNEQWFVIRGIIYFALWSLWAISIYRQSTKQDTEKSIEQMHAASRWSAPGLFLAVVVGSLAAFDWLMSIEPTWYSTIFGLVQLAGGSLSFFAIVTLVCLGFRRSGVLKNAITPEHYHDLAKWLFALTCFYAYVAYSQYMLIWYANIPEETQWFRHRIEGGWLPLSLSLPFLKFLIPFFILISRPAKRNLRLIGAMAVYSLVVEYIDLYWVVMPVFHKTGPQPHWLDVATLGATVSICGLVFWSQFRKHKMVPVGDLRIEQSLHFENA